MLFVFLVSSFFAYITALEVFVGSETAAMEQSSPDLSLHGVLDPKKYCMDV